MVTGAGAKKGVGRSTIFELAAHGVACVYACDFDDSNFDALIKECKEQYPTTEVFPFPMVIESRLSDISTIRRARRIHSC